MNRFACTFAALGLAAAASAALAAEPARPTPTLMTDAQMDNVTGGGVIDDLVTNALSAWIIDLDAAVQTNVLANVNAAVQAILSQNPLIGNPH